MSEYSRRDIMELDRVGGFFSKHMSAMTAEGLFDKADIAAELAYRDKRIAELEEEAFKLSAGVCEHLVGDEHGNPTCKYREKTDSSLLHSKWSHEGPSISVFYHKPDNIRFGINKAAREEMGNPKSVTFSYNKYTKTLLVSPAEEDDPQSYLISRYGQVSGKSIITQYNLKPVKNATLKRTSQYVWAAYLE